MNLDEESFSEKRTRTLSVLKQVYNIISFNFVKTVNPVSKKSYAGNLSEQCGLRTSRNIAKL